MARPVEEVCAQVLAATTPHSCLLLSSGVQFDAVRAAYKKLALLLHPDKNLGHALAGEAFKVCLRDGCRQEVLRCWCTQLRWAAQPS